MVVVEFHASVEECIVENLIMQELMGFQSSLEAVRFLLMPDCNMYNNNFSYQLFFNQSMVTFHVCWDLCRWEFDCFGPYRPVTRTPCNHQKERVLDIQGPHNDSVCAQSLFIKNSYIDGSPDSNSKGATWITLTVAMIWVYIKWIVSMLSYCTTHVNYTDNKRWQM